MPKKHHIDFNSWLEDRHETTWSKPRGYSDIGPTEKRRYTSFLKKLSSGFDYFSLILSFVFFIGIVLLIFVFNDFEVTIFDDGTAAVCVQNKSGVTQYVYPK